MIGTKHRRSTRRFEALATKGDRWRRGVRPGLEGLEHRQLLTTYSDHVNFDGPLRERGNISISGAFPDRLRVGSPQRHTVSG
jgi:hypothetical protein